MRKVFFAATIFLFFFLCGNTHAVYYYLTEEQTKLAIEYGEINKDTDEILFLDEWVSIADNSYEWAALNTKFSILAYEARQAALLSKQLTEEQIIQLPLEAEGIFSFRVVLYGNSADFTRDYYSVLLYKDKPILPVLEQNDMNAKPSTIGVRLPTIYRAVCRYDFPNYFVEPDAVITLAVISPLHRERKFVFNLKDIR